MTEFAAFLGIDWANDKHDLCLLDATTYQKEFFCLAHKPEVLAAFLRQLRLRYPHQPLAVGVEQARGPLTHPGAALGYAGHLKFPFAGGAFGLALPKIL